MRMPRVRFTVRRMMAVVALTAFLMAGTLLVIAPSEASQRAECSHNLKSICLGLHVYHSAHDAFPSGTIGSPDLSPDRRLAWTVVIFGYLEQGLGLLIDLMEPWDSPRNLRPLFQHTSTDGVPPPYTTSAANNPFLRCPVHRGRATPKGLSPTDYVGIAGLGTDAAVLPMGHPRAGLFGYDRKTRLADIRDGAGVTMMLAESDQQLVPWTAGGPSTVRGLDPDHQPYIGRGRQFGGWHRGGAMVAFADGSVRFLGETIDPKVFEALSTAAGGEPLAAGWDR